MNRSESWCMNVAGRIFGPYTSTQMGRFVEERRLAYHSLVAPAGSRDFRPAMQFSELRSFFRTKNSEPSGSEDGEKIGRASALLVILGTDNPETQAAHRMVSQISGVIPLSTTSYLIKTSRSAEAMRDELAALLPSSERALVFACGPSPAACHGVSLDEHDRIARLVANG